MLIFLSSPCRVLILIQRLNLEIMFQRSLSLCQPQRRMFLSDLRVRVCVCVHVRVYVYIYMCVYVCIFMVLMLVYVLLGVYFTHSFFNTF